MWTWPRFANVVPMIFRSPNHQKMVLVGQRRTVPHVKLCQMYWSLFSLWSYQSCCSYSKMSAVASVDFSRNDHQTSKSKVTTIVFHPPDVVSSKRFMGLWLQIFGVALSLLIFAFRCFLSLRLCYVMISWSTANNMFRDRYVGRIFFWFVPSDMKKIR